MATFHRQNSETRAIRSHFKAWQLFILRTLKPTATKSQGPAGACLLSKVLERRLKSGASHLFLHWNSRHILRCDIRSNSLEGKLALYEISTIYCKAKFQHFFTLSSIQDSSDFLWRKINFLGLWDPVWLLEVNIGPRWLWCCLYLLLSLFLTSLSHIGKPA